MPRKKPVTEETMGERVKRLRLEAGLSQAQLAEKAGVPIGTLRNWEYGRRAPLLGNATLVAQALGVGLDQLTGSERAKGK